MTTSIRKKTGKGVPTFTLQSVMRKINKQGYFRTKLIDNALYLYRDYTVCGKNRQIETILRKGANGMLSLVSDYNSNSAVSHYTYANQQEVRLNRNKAIITSIIRCLQKSEVWPLIDKSFLIINTHNQHITIKKRRELETQLKSIRR